MIAMRFTTLFYRETFADKKGIKKQAGLRGRVFRESDPNLKVRLIQLMQVAFYGIVMVCPTFSDSGRRPGLAAAIFCHCLPSL